MFRKNLKIKMETPTIETYINYLINQFQIQQQDILKMKIQSKLGIDSFSNGYQAIFFFSTTECDNQTIEKYQKEFEIKLDKESVNEFVNEYKNYQIDTVKKFEYEGQLELFILLQRENNNDKMIEKVVEELYEEKYTFKRVLDKLCKREIEQMKIYQRIRDLETRISDLENEIFTEQKLSEIMKEEVQEIVNESIQKNETNIENKIISTSAIIIETKTNEIIKEETEKMNATILSLFDDIQLLRDEIKQCHLSKVSLNQINSKFSSKESSLSSKYNNSSLKSPIQNPKDISIMSLPQLKSLHDNKPYIHSTPPTYPNTEGYHNLNNRNNNNINVYDQINQPISTTPSKNYTNNPYSINQINSLTPTIPQQLCQQNNGNYCINYNASSYQKQSHSMMQIQPLTIEDAKSMKSATIIDKYLDSMIQLSGHSQGEPMIDMKKNRTFSEIFNAIQGCESFILLFYLNTGEIFGSYHSVHPTEQNQPVKDSKHFTFSIANAYNEPVKRYNWLKKDQDVLTISDDEITISKLGWFGSKRNGYIHGENYPLNIYYDNTPMKGRKLFSESIHPKRLTWKDIQLIKLA